VAWVAWVVRVGLVSCKEGFTHFNKVQHTEVRHEKYMHKIPTPQTPTPPAAPIKTKTVAERAMFNKFSF